MKAKKARILTIVMSALFLLTSCGSTITQADLDAAYQQGYNDANSVVEEDAYPEQQDDASEESDEVVESTSTEETTNSQPSSNSDNGNSTTDQVQTDTQISDPVEETNDPAPDVVSVIATMQASAPVIDTKTIRANEGTAFETDVLYQPGEHIGEYNGVQVDTMLCLSSRADQEKYYAVTDDLKNVENTLRNAYDKNWLELGYTHCVPAICYDSRNNKYEENPYDMVHPGWEHSYAVLYTCTWSDGTTRCGVYYVRVSNNTDQEVMAILCPITSITDGLNFIC